MSITLGEFLRCVALRIRRVRGLLAELARSQLLSVLNSALPAVFRILGNAVYFTFVASICDLEKVAIVDRRAYPHRRRSTQLGPHHPAGAC